MGKKFESGRKENKNKVKKIDFKEKLKKENVQYIETVEKIEELSNYIYGRNAVLEALEAGETINKVWISKEARGRDIQEIINVLKEEKIVTLYIAKEKLDGMQKNNQGIIASINPFYYSEVDEILIDAKSKKENPFIVILDKIEDTHNLGAIIRSAEAAGVHGIIIPKRNAAQVTPLTLKTSAGAVSHMKVARVTNIKECVKDLKKQGIWIVGTELGNNPYHTQVDLKSPVGIVIGNEEKGISRIVKQECDILVKIPMIGKVQSLNASVSAGILIYEVVRQRMTN